MRYVDAFTDELPPLPDTGPPGSPWIDLAQHVTNARVFFDPKRREICIYPQGGGCLYLMDDGQWCFDDAPFAT